MSETPAEPRRDLPTEEQGRTLLQVARRELDLRFGLGVAAGMDLRLELGSPVGGLFATLELAEELRGCIGYLRCDVDLITLARRAVVAAALGDPRFPSVTREEVPCIQIGVTVLAPPQPIREPEQIEIGRHGLIVEEGTMRGLLLPQVAARYRWDGVRLLAETCRKAGLAPDRWRDSRISLQRFEAVHFEEAGRRSPV